MKRSLNTRVGDYVGYIDRKTKYLRIKITLRKKSIRIQGQNAAWYLYYGEWPEFIIDHRDLDRSHNAIENLRAASNSKNGANREASANNKLGIKGVTQTRSGKFIARIDYGSSYEFSRSYATVDEASAWYRKRSKELFGRFSRS